MVAAAASRGLTEAIIPVENADEASVVTGINCIPISNLDALIRHLKGTVPIPAHQPRPSQTGRTACGIDLSDVRGQAQVKRALEIAATGRHNLIMIGPPGCGKTMLARRIVSILPEMTYAESLETSRIFSVAGLLRHNGGLITERTFRTPHHTGSAASIIGGGSVPRPGEASLAHNGVLFLDELPEWRREVLEVLRQPLEERAVMITRVRHAVSFPADFLLISAMNPCPRGCQVGDGQKEFDKATRR